MSSAHGERRQDDDRQETWAVIHENLIRLALRRGTSDVEEARWLLAGLKHRVHEPLGFGSFLEYVERVLGYAPKHAAERIRVARALAELPALRDSVRRGELCWSAAREISRVAVPETVDAWIEECRDERIRDVERFVSGRKPGDLPTTPPDEAVRTHVVRFEVQGETLALLRAAQTAITRNADGHVTDDQLVRLLARAVLDGGADPGRAAYQLVVHECPSCGRAKAEGGGELVAVDETVAEIARCDGQVVHLDAGSAGRARAHARVGAEPARDGSVAPHVGGWRGDGAVANAGSRKTTARDANHTTGHPTRDRAPTQRALRRSGLPPRRLRSQAPHDSARRRGPARSRPDASALRSTPRRRAPGVPRHRGHLVDGLPLLSRGRHALSAW